MHKVFQLYDVLSFDSTEVIDLLIDISFPKLNNQIFSFRSIECMNMFLGQPQHLKLNYFADANPEKLQVKICKLSCQNFKFLGQKIGCPSNKTYLLP